MQKQIAARARTIRSRRSEGLSIAQLHREHLPAHLNPFLAFDHFEMAQPFFPPHPHAGFSAVTYMFPNSMGGFVNRDSFHPEPVEIGPGAIHWTGAGRGIVHEEVPTKRGVTAHGLQIFVDLPAAAKWNPPEVLHLDQEDIPRMVENGADIRVVAGSHGTISSPLAPPTDVTLLDVFLEAGGAVTHHAPSGESRFVYLIDGEADVAGEPLRTADAVGLSDGEGEIQIRSAKGAHLVIAGGAPLAQPVAFGGPFVMTNRRELERAVLAYRRGDMGSLEASF